MDYEKLTNDLKQALVAAKAVVTKDYGTFNFDTPYIRLPEAEPEKVKAAFKAAGISTYDKQGYTYYLFCMTGNQMRRTAEAETIAHKLAALGWKAYVEYAID